MHTAEKVETIVDCYRRHGTRAGTFGTCERALSGGTGERVEPMARFEANTLSESA